MRDLLPKVLKWAVNIFFLILALHLFTMGSEGHTWAFMLGIISVGVVYIQYNKNNDTPKEVMLFTVLVLVVTGLVAHYVSHPALDFYPMNAGFYEAWTGWSLVLGMPAIAWAFKKFD